ncbi:MAG: ATP-binding protein [Bacteroidaceae bacterium]
MFGRQRQSRTRVCPNQFQTTNLGIGIVYIQHDFEQSIDNRYNRKATIFASQLPIADWYNAFQSELIAETCLDKIVHKALKYQLSGERV